MIERFPLVTIVITNFNREKTIGQAIESALAQDYPNLEVIVSDNCSTDNSNHVISRYISDTRIKYYKNEINVGMYENFRICFEERAKGDFITIVNSDDEFIYKKFISECVNLVHKHPSIKLIKSNFESHYNTHIEVEKYNQFGDFLKRKDFYAIFNLLNHDFGWPGIFLNRHDVVSLGKLGFKYSSFDLIINLFLITKGDIGFINHNSYKYNLHGQNISLNMFSIESLQHLKKEIKEFCELNIVVENFDIFRSNIKEFFFLSIFSYYYINDRKNISKVIQILNFIDKEYFDKFYNTLKIWKFKIIYFFPKVGNLYMSLKKSIR